VASGNINFRLLLAVSLSQLLGVMVLAKHFREGDYHWLLPVLMSSALSLMLIMVCMRQIVDELENKAKGLRKISHSVFKINIKWLLPIIVIISILVRMNWIWGLAWYFSWSKNERLEVYQKAENEYKGYAKIYYYGSASPAYAFALGEMFSRGNNSEILRELYPDAYSYHVWLNIFYHWDNHDIPFEEILSQYGKKIIIQGPPNAVFISIIKDWAMKNPLIPGLSIIDILKGKDQTIYELHFAPENGVNPSP
jgi:hypothetical protein